MSGIFSPNQPKPVYIVDSDTGIPQSQNQDVVVSGEVITSLAAVQFPTVAGNFVKIKAMPQNVGRVYIGPSAAVVKRTGLTSAVTGFPLSANESTDWMPISNLGKFWHIDDNATDSIAYMVLS